MSGDGFADTEWDGAMHCAHCGHAEDVQSFSFGREDGSHGYKCPECHAVQGEDEESADDGDYGSLSCGECGWAGPTEDAEILGDGLDWACPDCGETGRIDNS